MKFVYFCLLYYSYSANLNDRFQLDLLYLFLSGYIKNKKIILLFRITSGAGIICSKNNR